MQKAFYQFWLSVIKWYYHFYVEDASGNLVQKEFMGTESKSETGKLLRQAMEDYEEKSFHRGRTCGLRKF